MTVHVLTLPFPPSVNHYWYHAKGRHFIRERGIRYRAAVVAEIRAQRLATGFSGNIAVSLTVRPPDRRKRDLDNLLKAPLDALQYAGIYQDDNQITDIRIRRGSVVKGGCLEVTLTFPE